MALPVWGNLEKSQIDNEKIEEAIDRRIQAHEDDPDAHLETGESLQSHKASAIIDHLATSIIADKIGDGEVIASKFGFIHFPTFFESIDGYIKSAGVSFLNDYVELLTAASSSDLQYLKKRFPIAIFGMSWDKNHDLEFTFSTDALHNIEVVICAGDVGIKRHIGIKIASSNVLGTVGNGTTETTVGLGAVDPTAGLVARIVFTTGEKCEFYINGVLEGTISTNLPTGVTDAHFVVNAYVKTLENVSHALYLYAWDFKQDI